MKILKLLIFISEDLYFIDQDREHLRSYEDH
jgi:hypothetical protein